MKRLFGPDSETISRRKLLQGMALGSAAIAANVVYPTGSARAAVRPHSARAVNRLTSPIQVAVGTVVSVNANQFKVMGVSGTTWVVSTDGSTTLWRNAVNPVAVAAGDYVVAKGLVDRSTGVIEASDVWVNLRWRRGTVTAVRGGEIVLRNARSGGGTVDADATSMVFRGPTSSAFDGQITIGQYVEALGYVDKGGNVAAHRLWVQPTSG